MSEGVGVGSAEDAASSGWRDALSLVGVVSTFLVGLLAGWYGAILALHVPLYPWLGALIAPALGVAAWRLRRRPWLCALWVGGCLSAAAGWALLVLAGVALANA